MSFTLTIGFCVLSVKKLMCLSRHKEIFAVDGGSVPLATFIMDEVNGRRSGDKVSESSVLDPGMLLKNPQLFVLGMETRVQHALWAHILQALTTMRVSAQIGHLVNAACAYVPKKVADAWEQANSGSDGGLEPLDEMQLSDALSSSFIAALVRPLPVA
jgi:hypothetical protein